MPHLHTTSLGWLIKLQYLVQKYLSLENYVLTRGAITNSAENVPRRFIATCARDKFRHWLQQPPAHMAAQHNLECFLSSTTSNWSDRR